MKVQYFGDRIEITGNDKEIGALKTDYFKHGQEITVTMHNNWGGCFALAANLKSDGHEVEIINEDAEPVKEKKPRKKKETVIVPGPTKKRLSTLRKTEIVIMREAGKSDDDIASALGLEVEQVEGYKPESAGE